jgi:hypothetical protein
MSNPQKRSPCSKRNSTHHLRGFLRGILILEALRATSSASLPAIGSHPQSFRLQQVQHSGRKIRNLFARNWKIAVFSRRRHLEDDIKDLAGCRLIFYTNSDVSRFLQSGIIHDNFDVDWDRTKIHHPVPGQTEPDNLFISNNYVLKLKPDRTALPEYARFAGLWCEVQV